MSTNLSKKPLSNIFNVLLLAASLLIILRALVNDTFQDYGDFRTAYLAAQNVLTGAPLYGGFYIYPPFFAFLMTPLAQLPMPAARWVWLGGNVLFIGLISILSFRMLANGLKFKASTWQAIGACALTVLLTQDQIMHVFREGQNDLLILLGFVLALYWLDRHPLVAGAILGVITVIKYQALFFLPFLLLRARWRATAGFVAGIILAALLPAVMIGWQRNLDYLAIALHGFAAVAQTASESSGLVQVPKILWIGSTSISSGLARIFHDQGWSIANALVCIAILLGLVFAFLWKTFQNHRIPFIWRSPVTLGNPPQEAMVMNLEWNILLVCMLIFSPDCTRRHLMLVFGFNLLAVVMLFFPLPSVKRWPIIVAIVIAQVGQLNFGFSPSFYNGQFVGLPSWGYLIALLILTPYALTYFRHVLTLNTCNP